MPEASASIQPGMSKIQTIPDRLMPTLNTRSLSRRMNIIFWVVWSVFLLLELIMISDEFTWARCLLFLGIQAALVFLRTRFFGKMLPALLAWLAALVLVFAVIAFTGADSEEMAFKQYKDYRQVDQAAVKVLDSFATAADQGDVKTAVSYIEESRQKRYAELFAKDPQKMNLLAEALDGAEMSQLTHPEPAENGFPRYAEYAVEYEGMTFHIRLVQVQGRWMIHTL